MGKPGDVPSRPYLDGRTGDRRRSELVEQRVRMDGWSYNQLQEFPPRPPARILPEVKH